MIYIIAVILGLGACAQSFASEITGGNITHLKNGRPANAGAALFPTFPFLPLLFVCGAWILRMAVAEFAIWLLMGAYVALSLAWAFSSARLRAELRQRKASNAALVEPEL